MADALIRLQYQPAAAVFAKLTTDGFPGFGHGSGRRRLAAMGRRACGKGRPPVHGAARNNDARNEAAGLLLDGSGRNRRRMVDQARGRPQERRLRLCPQTPATISPRCRWNEGAAGRDFRCWRTPLPTFLAPTAKRASAAGRRAENVGDQGQRAGPDRGVGRSRTTCSTGAPKPVMEALGKVERRARAVAVARTWRISDSKPRDKAVVPRPSGDDGSRSCCRKAVAAFVTHPDQGVRAEAEKLLRF